MRRCGGTVELVDVSSELPQLVRRPGLEKWKVSFLVVPMRLVLFGVKSYIAGNDSLIVGERVSTSFSCLPWAIFSHMIVFWLLMQVRDRGQWLASYKDIPNYRRSVLTPGMFPSGKLNETSEHDFKTAADQSNENGNSNNENMLESNDDSIASANNLEAEVSDMPLERCMRIVPHDQNSGAFFIAVLHKLSPLPGTFYCFIF